MKYLFVISALAVSCSKEPQLTSELVGKPISFQYDVFPIIEQSCLSCHNQGAYTIELHDYEHIDSMAATGQLLGSITGDTLYTQMPPNGINQLTPTQIEIISRWIEDGHEDN